MAQIFVAADHLHLPQTQRVLERILAAGVEFGIKINADFITEYGLREAVPYTKGFGRPLFFDLKMLNDEERMRPTARFLAEKEVEYFTAHAMGCSDLKGVVEETKGSKTKVLGVTTPTYYTEEYWNHHFLSGSHGAVRKFAKCAMGAGCHGIVLPGPQLDAIKDLQGVEAVLKVTPGIRWSPSQNVRHKQAIDPATAVAKGADILVVGGPIMEAEDPVAALHELHSMIAPKAVGVSS